MIKKNTKKIALGAAAAVIGTAVVFGAAASKSTPAAKPAAAPAVALPSTKAALTVNAARPQEADWQTALSANGSIAAWHEAVVGSELGGLRLAEVRAEVGDSVRKGQVLARLFGDSVAADLAQQEGAMEEANAALAEAQANAEGARQLASSGAMSDQQTTQYLVAERSAKARVASAKARLDSARIRMRQTVVLADDDGVISSRSATQGAVTTQGQELFRIIRQNRLEWRAEVTGNDLLRIKPGQHVRLRATNGAAIEGTVRALGANVDAGTRNALVYVDLPASSAVRAGMFASGSFELGSAPALTIAQTAVVTRDGFDYVFVIQRDGSVVQTRVTLGRRIGERIEVTSGAERGMLLVSQGGGFLTDGDVVAVATPAPLPSQSKKKLAAAATPALAVK
ncbi:efflux RND transporter periplasmic adaptor subunit [Massilia atriviolacea]|uniref:efflux RND transporter periplasmic adaptor subunit n=1 Tax=Massilia atriviolacea TaxID=2495579 RepID=UPI001E3CEEDD|nr:efflux RND transporter periplasmic adaptor subunit [Massilia atriviolacea]